MNSSFYHCIPHAFAYSLISHTCRVFTVPSPSLSTFPHAYLSCMSLVHFLLCSFCSFFSCCFNKLPLCASFIESAARCCCCRCRCRWLPQLLLRLTCIQCGLKAANFNSGGAGHAKLGCCSICVNVNIARTCEFVTLRVALRDAFFAALKWR